MADTKISALTAVTVPAGTDIHVVVQGGVTKRETTTQILAVTQTAATITGGTINATAIGGSTPAAVACTTLAASGNVTTNGVLAIEMTGKAANAELSLRCDAGKSRFFSFRTGTAARWLWECDATAESGASAGSDFKLKAYNDSGFSIGTALAVTRATMNATFGAALAVTGDFAVNTNKFTVAAATGNTLIAGTGTITGGFGCNTKAAQTAYASGGALNAYTTGAFGLNSDANMSALHAMVVAIRAALVANGTMS